MLVQRLSRGVVFIALGLFICLVAFASSACSASSSPAPSGKESEKEHAAASLHNAAQDQCGSNVYASDAAELFLRGQSDLDRASGTWDFQIDSHHYDSCQPLSWIVLRGGMGTTTGYALLLFSGPHLLADPAPVIEAAPPRIARTGPAELAITRGTSAPVTITANNVAAAQPAGNFASSLPRLVVTPADPAPDPGGLWFRLEQSAERSLLCRVDPAGPVFAECESDTPTTWKTPTEPHAQAQRVQLLHSAVTALSDRLPTRPRMPHSYEVVREGDPVREPGVELRVLPGGTASIAIPGAGTVTITADSYALDRQCTVVR